MDPALILLLWIGTQSTWAMYWLAFRNRADLGRSPLAATLSFGHAVFHGGLGLLFLFLPGPFSKCAGGLWLVTAAAWVRLGQRFSSTARGSGAA